MQLPTALQPALPLCLVSLHT